MLSRTVAQRNAVRSDIENLIKRLEDIRGGTHQLKGVGAEEFDETVKHMIEKYQHLKQELNRLV